MPERPYKVKDILKRTKLSRRQLGLWGKYKIIEINKQRNPITGNEDRYFSEDDIRRILWIKEQLESGLSIDAVRLLVEFHTTGKIKSRKWYK